MKPVFRSRGDFRWEGIEVLPYKPAGTHFRDISRQLLFGSEDGLGCELRYFEIDPGGHSTLERHAHRHAVLIVRGAGRVLVGREVYALETYDGVRIPPWTWHQFRASAQRPLGFLCMVDRERDRPERPSPAELEELRRDAALAEFIRT